MSLFWSSIALDDMVQAFIQAVLTLFKPFIQAVSTQFGNFPGNKLDRTFTGVLLDELLRLERHRSGTRSRRSAEAWLIVY